MKGADMKHVLTTIARHAKHRTCFIFALGHEGLRTEAHEEGALTIKIGE